MRLICPNCDAEYEVDGSLLPAEGRDVQCSNCNNTWFQKPESTEDPLDLTHPAEAAGLTPQRPQTDPEALEIIHEEVARETAARVSEAGGIESQPDLGLDDAEITAIKDALDDSDLIDDTNDAALAPAPRRGESAKKELFPDIEEINSTLASAPDPVYDEDGEEIVPNAANPRRGFRIGFGLMLMLTALVLGVYAYAPALAERFPALAGVLSSYVAIIDSMRVALEAGAQWLLQKVTALTEQVGS